MHYARYLRHGDPGSAEMHHLVSVNGLVCSVTECARQVKAKGLCNPHYKKLLRHGDPLSSGQRTRRLRDGAPDPEMILSRFWSKVDRSDSDGCWTWLDAPRKTGYGMFSAGADRGQVLAHRFSYEQASGPIGSEMVIDHLCRNRICVRPDHLEAVTNLENLRRGAGYAIRNGMRSCCVNGHEYTEDNTYRDPGGGIRCRTCARIRDRSRPRISSNNRRETLKETANG